MVFSLRKADFLLFFVILAAAAIIAAAPLLLSSPDSGGLHVRITCGGEVVGIYPLEEDDAIEISRGGHLNLVTIDDGAVYMEYSDCRNQVCVDTGRITRPGDTIVCLPNRVVVEIISRTKGGAEDEAIDAVVQ